MPFTARTFPSIKSGLDTFPQIFQQVCSFDRSSHKTDGKKDATCYQIRPQIIDRTADDTFPKGQLLEEKEVSSELLIERMSAAVHQFVGDAEQSDDLTMLAIKRRLC